MDLISKEAAIEMLSPAVQERSNKEFEEIVVEFPNPDTCVYEEYKGMPYYSIKFHENGETRIGFGSYSTHVISDYLKKYFMPSAQPERKKGEVKKMDLISRQDAIDALTKERLYLLERDMPGAEHILIHHAINVIENLPSAQQWIPCSERLPEEDGKYIVCYEEGYREDYGFDEIGIAPFEVDSEGFGIWQERFDLGTLGSLGSDWVDIPVIAWMPLPEEYKGE